MIEAIVKILRTDKGHNNKPVVLKEVENGCIVCTSHKLSNKGYLILRRGGKRILAHRLVYEAFYGPIPEGMCVCHHCDNPACLNPQDFFAGMHSDNMRDRDQQGRCSSTGQTWTRGEGCGHSKLTTEQIYEIRQKYQSGEYTQVELGYEYGVRNTNIWHIVNNKTWKYLEHL